NPEASTLLLETLLGDARRNFGEGDRRTLDTGARLVYAYTTMAEYDRALTLTNELLPVARREVGESDPITSYLLGNLGSVYMNLDRCEHAELTHRQFHERLREQIGPEESPTQLVAATLAVSIPVRQEGLRMLRELEARQTAQYGVDAPQLVATLVDLAWV